MSTTPASSTPDIGFQPAFKRVQQSNDHDDAFACIAMLTGKTLDEIKQTAIDKFRHPKHGPATCWVSEELIGKLLAHYGLVGTIYKEGMGVASLPDVAIGMVEYDPETEIGRHVIFHRLKYGKNTVEYIIDPAYWLVDQSKHIRTDIKGFPISFYIGVHQMAKPAAKGEK